MSIERILWPGRNPYSSPRSNRLLVTRPQNVKYNKLNVTEGNQALCTVRLAYVFLSYFISFQHDCGARKQTPYRLRLWKTKNKKKIIKIFTRVHFLEFSVHRLIAPLSIPASTPPYLYRYNTQSLRSTKTDIHHSRPSRQFYYCFHIYIYKYVYLYLCVLISCSRRCASPALWVTIVYWRHRLT